MPERWSRNAADALLSADALRKGIRARRTALITSARRSGVKVLARGSRIPVMRPFAELGMQMLFDGLAPRWDRIRDDPTYKEGFLDALRHLPRGFEPSRALDVACGTGHAAGWLLTRWPEAEVTGCDISPRMVELATQSVPGATFVAAGARHLPADDRSIDLLVSLDGVVYAPEVARVLAPKGRALIVYSKQGTTPVSRPLDDVATEFAAASMSSEQHTDGPAHVLMARHLQAERRRARRR